MKWKDYKNDMSPTNWFPSSLSQALSLRIFPIPDNDECTWSQSSLHSVSQPSTKTAVALSLSHLIPFRPVFVFVAIKIEVNWMLWRSYCKGCKYWVDCYWSLAGNKKDITFIVYEYLINVQEIFIWMKCLPHPIRFHVMSFRCHT